MFNGFLRGLWNEGQKHRRQKQVILEEKWQDAVKSLDLTAMMHAHNLGVCVDTPITIKHPDHGHELSLHPLEYLLLFHQKLSHDQTTNPQVISLRARLDDRKISDLVEFIVTKKPQFDHSNRDSKGRRMTDRLVCFCPRYEDVAKVVTANMAYDYANELPTVYNPRIKHQLYMCDSDDQRYDVAENIYGVHSAVRKRLRSPAKSGDSERLLVYSHNENRIVMGLQFWFNRSPELENMPRRFSAAFGGFTR